MDFRLKVFIVVAKHLSFTKAAKELSISQPAVTKHIQELESMYKVQLFERNKGKISLTPAGILFLKHANDIIAKYEMLAGEMQFFADDFGGEIKIEASSDALQTLVNPLFAEFINKFPNIKVSYINKKSEQID